MGRRKSPNPKLHLEEPEANQDKGENERRNNQEPTRETNTLSLKLDET